MSIILYRFCAKLIDVIGYVFVVGLINFIFRNLNLTMMTILALLVYVMWFIIAPLRFQKTLGKKLLGLKVDQHLDLIHVILREPFTYLFILIVLAQLVFKINLVLASYLELAALVLSGIMLVMFYFKHDIWNKLNHCEVVENKK